MEDTHKKILIHVPVKLPLDKLIKATKGTGFILMQNKKDFYIKKKSYTFLRVRTLKSDLLEQALILTKKIRELDTSITETNMQVNLW